eukprot:2209108-Alexandrium_andersonii.AAC.1
MARDYILPPRSRLPKVGAMAQDGPMGHEQAHSARRTRATPAANESLRWCHAVATTRFDCERSATPS